MRSPRIPRKIKGSPRSPARRVVAGTKLTRGARGGRSASSGGSSTRSQSSPTSSFSWGLQHPHRHRHHTGSSRGSRSSSASSRLGSSSTPRSPIGSPSRPGTEVTTGDVPAANPNHPKEMKRKGKGGALPRIPQAHAGRLPAWEGGGGPQRGGVPHLWEDSGDWRACGRHAPHCAGPYRRGV